MFILQSPFSGICLLQNFSFKIQLKNVHLV